MTRLDKLRTSMEKAGLDSVLITSEINQKYLSRFSFTDGYLLITGKRACLITDSRYREAAKAEATGFEVLCPENMMLGIRDLLTEEGIHDVGIEDHVLPLSTYRFLEERLKGCELLPMGGMIDRLREYKDAEEIDRIRAAQKITDDAFTHILSVLTPEMTECEVALELEFFMRRAGAEEKSFDTICVSGAASSMPHGVPQRRRLERGFLTMDFGCTVDGYHSDMTRTVFLGRADGEQKRLYETVLAAQTAAITEMQVGMLCSDIDAIARDLIYRAGYRGCFGHALGHGVGLQIHEAPRFSPAARDTRLSPGHVVTVEPGIYLEGKYGCRIEDMIVAGESGIEDLTHSRHELIELF